MWDISDTGQCIDTIKYDLVVLFFQCTDDQQHNFPVSLVFMFFTGRVSLIVFIRHTEHNILMIFPNQMCTRYKRNDERCYTSRFKISNRFLHVRQSKSGKLHLEITPNQKLKLVHCPKRVLYSFSMMLRDSWWNLKRGRNLIKFQRCWFPDFQIKIVVLI